MKRLLVVLFGLAWAVNSAVAAPTGERFVVLTDPCVHGTQKGSCDPDDVMALAALQAAGHEPLAIIAAAGNGHREIVWRTAQRYADWAPTYQGHGGCNSPGQQALAAALEAGPLTVLALGPLTDLAMLTECRPDLVANINEVIFVGGRRDGEEFYLGNPFNPFRGMRDLNVYVDQRAVATVLNHDIALTLVPFRAGKEVRVKVSDVARYLSPDAVASAQTWAFNIAWLDHDPLQAVAAIFTNSVELPAFDPMAALAFMQPHTFGCEKVSLSLQSGDLIVVTDEAGAHQSCLPLNADMAEVGFVQAFRGEQVASFSTQIDKLR